MYEVRIKQRMAKEVRVNKVSLAILIALGTLVTVYVISSVKKRGPLEAYQNVVRLSELISASIDLASRAGDRVVEIRSMNDEEIGKLSKGLTKEGKKEYVTLGDKVSDMAAVFFPLCTGVW